MAGMRGFMLLAMDRKHILRMRCRQPVATSSQISATVVQPAVPLWKVIVDQGRQDLSRARVARLFHFGLRRVCKVAATSGRCTRPLARLPTTRVMIVGNIA